MLAFHCLQIIAILISKWQLSIPKADNEFSRGTGAAVELYRMNFYDISKLRRDASPPLVAGPRGHDLTLFLRRTPRSWLTDVLRDSCSERKVTLIKGFHLSDGVVTELPKNLSTNSVLRGISEAAVFSESMEICNSAV
ncbi:hypothetical protein EVAR_14820_1 [Eumeta japonica]|uniref:Uncharacterized protein n=1 Tax=Eumeta variegata TaxID=151549 RepID=A0A4C1V3L7_EUMVA|nr:hypothetical protein EVAR_14820_1 [Eumeta japonica]